jgi:hypothetical protein
VSSSDARYSHGQTEHGRQVAAASVSSGAVAYVLVCWCRCRRRCCTWTVSAAPCLARWGAAAPARPCPCTSCTRTAALTWCPCRCTCCRGGCGRGTASCDGTQTHGKGQDWIELKTVWWLFLLGQHEHVLGQCWQPAEHVQMVIRFFEVALGGAEAPSRVLAMGYALMLVARVQLLIN